MIAGLLLKNSGLLGRIAILEAIRPGKSSLQICQWKEGIVGRTCRDFL